MDSFAPTDELLRLATALGIGLLIGTERGWQSREREDGERVAGLRTFALIGLFGGVAAVIVEPAAPWLVIAGFLGLAALMVTAYFLNAERSGFVGLTTEVAALLVYALGALAGFGETLIAAVAGVIVMAILGAKPILHAWIQKLERHELDASVKLLLISVVLLPVLPDRDMGPFGAFNPYQLWWMVVLIAAVSFVGYFLVRIVGAERGVYLTGLAGGLVSSTAVTLNLSRLARDAALPVALLASGTLAACATMFPRILVVVAAIDRTLLVALLAPFLTAGVVCYGAAWYFARRLEDGAGGQTPPLTNPLELGTALRFGALLLVISFAARVLAEYVGDTGLLVLAGVGGLADVDAITLSFGSMVGEGISIAVATTGLLIAATSNSIVKIGLAITIGGRAFGARVAAGLAASLVAGALVAIVIQ